MFNSLVLGVVAARFTWLIVLVGIIGGAFFFRMFSGMPDDDRKRLLETVSGLAATFVIVFLFGKIVIQFPLFIEEPRAVLSYPSGRKSFYLASAAVALQAAYLIKQKQAGSRELFEAGLQILLPALLIHKFLSIVYIYSGVSSADLVEFGFLLVIILYLTFKEVSFRRLAGVWVAWLGMKLAVSYFSPLLTVMGVLVDRWYLFILLAGSIIYITQTKNRRGMV
ncbi:hypothetical protein [Bacillus marinisedimentorum]|uniref:hypothetical protein n=1 Tax=Bacillus marinisedimentorum TaxID=1821260 RepID=UPI00087242B6|nr:hypothetical protein [Bacillus marinisedimentorum]